MRLSSEQAFLSDLDSPNMKQQMDAVIRGDLTSVQPPETLASHWGTGKEIARHTLDITTQLGVRTIYILLKVVLEQLCPICATHI